ncbi:hypothetical protein LAZ67_1000086 [Cordylochernes scorpioides]|uniref:Uncharacterized protein n=1 Tax=Cordylochernes scorpioides TaxID=51811 RepID=A0ABY6JUW7_9ARAC|nr:hypothetical protein LAZ67_1000086 [Cordylochernes scorpioides]
MLLALALLWTKSRKASTELARRGQENYQFLLTNQIGGNLSPKVGRQQIYYSFLFLRAGTHFRAAHLELYQQINWLNFPGLSRSLSSLQSGGDAVTSHLPLKGGRIKEKKPETSRLIANRIGSGI